jgi:membrane protein
VEWKDVWHGAFVTAILFSLAKFALGVYFAKNDPSSAYGQQGSIMLIMLWVSHAGIDRAIWS